MVAAGVLSVGLLLGPRIAMAWMLVQQENRVQQEIVGLSAPFPQHAPADQYQISLWPKPEKQSKGFFLQLEELEKARQSVPAMEIDLLEYDAQQNTLTLSVSAQNQPALQAFVNQTSENFDFTLQPVSTTEPYTAMIAGKHK